MSSLDDICVSDLSFVPKHEEKGNNAGGLGGGPLLKLKSDIRYEKGIEMEKKRENTLTK